MKSKNRIQILLRILSKSDQIIEGVIQLNMQIYPSQQGLYIPSEKTSLLTGENFAQHKNDPENYRNSLIEQMKTSSTDSLIIN